MEIRPVQFNINTKSKDHKHYLEAQGAVDTTGKVKPLPGKGHLIHDNLSSATKYFFKDIAYDFKSLKNGFNGTANDHQLGRLNDLGLKMGGIGIATYLASKTPDPKAKVMEFVGLTAFLAAMNVYPKIAINKPAELFHGYDIDKWYIDDQGRKKSVNQDSNYVPYDLYRGEAKGEDLDEIGDKMGIPRDIKNRHEIIKEQMRKISTQSNTLWMLTAGFATPIMTALACFGLENYVVSPGLEAYRNHKFNNKITKILGITKEMSTEVSTISENNLSKKVGNILSKYLTSNVEQEFPLEEKEHILELLTENIDSHAGDGIKSDVEKIFEKRIILNEGVTKDIVESAKKRVSGSHSDAIKSILIPEASELQKVIETVIPNIDFEKDSLSKLEDVEKVKKAILNLIDSKIENAPSSISKDYLLSVRNEIYESIGEVLASNETAIVTEESRSKLVDLAKILGEFKDNKKVLDKCKSFKFEQTQETVLARYYAKFEKTLLKELGFTTKEMKSIRESEDLTLKLLDEKIKTLCSNEEKCSKAFGKLSKIISQMEVALHGSEESASHILDLFNAIENNYNNTAKRLANLGGFGNTIKNMVNEDVATLSNSATTRAQVFDMLDGIVQSADGELKNFVESSKGVGSSKYYDISRAVERYQGVINSFNRILNTFDFYKRSMDSADFRKSLIELQKEQFKLSRDDAKYVEKLISEGKNTLLTATSADMNLKMGNARDFLFFRDLMHSIWTPLRSKSDNSTKEKSANSTKAESFVSKNIESEMGKFNEMSKGNVLDRFKTFITSCRNIIANSNIDFTKPQHVIDGSKRNLYKKSETTNMAFFNKVAQNPVKMVKEGAKRQYGTRKWFSIVAGVTTAVFAGTILAQAGFGRIKNPHNIKKQVENEAN